MELKVGDKVRVKTLAEMLATYSQNFFAHDFFEKWGNHKLVITKVTNGYLGKKYKINVDDNWGFYYISSSAVEKINNKIDLPNELFEL